MSYSKTKSCPRVINWTWPSFPLSRNLKIGTIHHLTIVTVWANEKFFSSWASTVKACNHIYSWWHIGFSKEQLNTVREAKIPIGQRKLNNYKLMYLHGFEDVMRWWTMLPLTNVSTLCIKLIGVKIINILKGRFVSDVYSTPNHC